MSKWAFVVAFSTEDIRIPERIGMLAKKRFNAAFLKTLTINCDNGHQLALWWEDYWQPTLTDVLEIIAMEAQRLNVNIAGCSFLGTVPAEALLVVAHKNLKLTGFPVINFSEQGFKTDCFGAIRT